MPLRSTHFTIKKYQSTENSLKQIMRYFKWVDTVKFITTDNLLNSCIRRNQTKLYIYAFSSF